MNMAMPNYWNVESVMKKKQQQEDEDDEDSQQWDYRYVYGYYHDEPSARE